MPDQGDMSEFFKGGRWAVVGVSRDPFKYGYIVHRRLKSHGEEVFAVNPRADEIDGETCYASLADVPDSVEQVVIVLPPRVTEEVVKEVANRGVTKVWMQPGAESSAAVEFCRSQGINIVSGSCILRYMDRREARDS